jgi:hypothetical protein
MRKFEIPKRLRTCNNCAERNENGTTTVCDVCRDKNAWVIDPERVKQHDRVEERLKDRKPPPNWFDDAFPPYFPSDYPWIPYICDNCKGNLIGSCQGDGFCEKHNNRFAFYYVGSICPECAKEERRCTDCGKELPKDKKYGWEADD